MSCHAARHAAQMLQPYAPTLGRVVGLSTEKITQLIGFNKCAHCSALRFQWPAASCALHAAAEAAAATLARR